MATIIMIMTSKGKMVTVRVIMVVMLIMVISMVIVMQTTRRW